MLKLMISLAVLITATTSLLAWSQDSDTPAEAPHPGLHRRVDSMEFQEDSWRERLAGENLDQREAAFEELIQRARHDGHVRRILGRWAEGSGELAWTARLALRELETRTRSPLDSSPFGDGLFRRGFSAPDIGSLQATIDQWLEELGAGAPSGPPGAPGNGSRAIPGVESHSGSMNFELGPDGVRVELEEQHQDGSSSRKVYEARDLEELHELHPELRDRLGLHPQLLDSLRDRLPDPGRILDRRGEIHERLEEVRERLDRLRRNLGPGAHSNRDSEGLRRAGQQGPSTLRVERRDVLGVYLGEVVDGGGLVIQGVMPGTFAQVLGLRPGEILLQLDGLDLKHVDDVRRVMGERDAAAALRVKIRSVSGRLQELIWESRPE